MDVMIIVWIAVAIVGLVIFLWFFPVTLWFQALISGVKIGLVQLVLMRWRGVSPNTIVMAMVTGTKAGLKLYANELEAHYLAKGNVPKVVNALISADKANSDDYYVYVELNDSIIIDSKNMYEGKVIE